MTDTERPPLNPLVPVYLLLAALLLAGAFVSFRLSARFDGIHRKLDLLEDRRETYEYETVFIPDLGSHAHFMKLTNNRWRIITARRAKDSADKWGYECIVARPSVW